METTPRNITKFLLNKQKKSEQIRWRLKTPLRNISGTFYFRPNNHATNQIYPLCIELDIIGDGDAYFPVQKLKKLEERFGNILKTSIKKFHCKITDNLLIINTSNKAKTREMDVFHIIEAILQFVSEKDIIHSIALDAGHPEMIHYR